MVKTKASTNYQEVSDMRRMTSQKGFTLVEIAIVLVIIGLLLGALLKGQEMISSAKIKRVVKQADEIRAAALTYQDLYKYLPGDDPATVGLQVGNGDGLVAAGANEQADVFVDLAAKNLVSGTYTAARPYPTHAFGGQIWLVYAAVQGKTTQWIQYQNIPGDRAQIIDTTYDDGNFATGSIRGSGAYTGATVTLSNEF
jgi:prepilin-type N-terminal cleavage/methylation domain-containing protein